MAGLEAFMDPFEEASSTSSNESNDYSAFTNAELQEMIDNETDDDIIAVLQEELNSRKENDDSTEELFLGVNDDLLLDMLDSENDDKTRQLIQYEVNRRGIRNVEPTTVATTAIPKTAPTVSSPAIPSNVGLFNNIQNDELQMMINSENDESYRQILQNEMQRRKALQKAIPVEIPEEPVEEPEEVPEEPEEEEEEVPEEPEEVPEEPVEEPEEVPEEPEEEEEVKVPEEPEEEPEEPEEEPEEVPEEPEEEVKVPEEEPEEKKEIPTEEEKLAPISVPRRKVRRPVIIEEEPIAIPISRRKTRRPVIEEKTSIEESAYDSLTDTELLDLWNTMPLSKERDLLITTLQRRDLFPSEQIKQWEYDTGAYPDIVDPEFLQKLLSKREFAESLQQTWKPRTDPCKDTTTFEVATFQRFAANFMSPRTPYMSALLFYGVGVGKTCGGIQIAEAWLDTYTQNEVFIISPPTIQQGFYRTIFDITKVVIGKDNEPNTASQCTGTTYMKLTNTLYERDKSRIDREVQRLIRKRYNIMGYVSFVNHIKQLLAGIPDHVPSSVADEMKKKAIRDEFSGKLIIVDEAHNLRDIVGSGDGSEDALAGGKEEKTDTAGGKILTPFLLDVLRYSEGLKFCALSATPMYNSYREIIFMMNMLLLNDKKATLTERDLFEQDGTIHEKGEKILSWVAQRYISFMRGENPVSFPIRLFPEQISTISSYPSQTPRGVDIDMDQVNYTEHLPIVPIELQGATLEASRIFMDQLLLKGTGVGMNTVDLDRLIHAGNIVVPATDATTGTTEKAYRLRTDMNALQTVFDTQVRGGEITYYARDEVNPEWLLEENIEAYSPKFHFFLKRARHAEGCIFAYTRFINGGALPLALALEANGYTPSGRRHPLLGDGVIAKGGRQCALCPNKEREHSGKQHAFTPAYYGILTGNTSISPNNDQMIQTQRGFPNANGVQMKIIIGSQVASEGVDLRFVRETHVMDAWYHLNKTEQILGRSIRFLSHCALPAEKRNVTVYLYTAVFPESINESRETGDLYCYRIAFEKSIKIGKVTRILKQSAIDCNLNRPAIVITGQDPVRQIDSQRQIRSEVNINDMPFTAVCDWTETCDYTCKPNIDVKKIEAYNNSSYDEYTARHRIHEIKQRIRYLFSAERQPFYQSEDMWNLLSDVPRIIVIDLLNEIINNKEFQVRRGDLMGYIRYCNGYYLFQPNVYNDLTIPLAVRVARFPIKRDEYFPMALELPEIAIEEEKINTTQTIQQVWKSIQRWSEQLPTTSKYPPPPSELNQFRYDHAPYDEEKQMKMLQMLEMIQWFHISFHASGQGDANAFRRMILFYFWDEWLTIEEQKFLMYSPNIDVTECIIENQYKGRNFVADRMLDPKTGEIIYLCKDPVTGKGTECSRVIMDLIRSDSNDPLRTHIIHPRNTGEPYGFIAPKDGRFVFKTNKLPGPDGKIRKGEECANVSITRGHMTKLLQIGMMLEDDGLSDFDLNAVKLYHSREITNSNRICTVLDLFLRYLDGIGLQNRRWFYRPVPAFYTGHRGMFHPSAVSSAPSASKKDTMKSSPTVAGPIRRKPRPTPPVSK